MMYTIDYVYNSKEVQFLHTYLHKHMIDNEISGLPVRWHQEVRFHPQQVDDSNWKHGQQLVWHFPIERKDEKGVWW